MHVLKLLTARLNCLYVAIAQKITFAQVEVTRDIINSAITYSRGVIMFNLILKVFTSELYPLWCLSREAVSCVDLIKISCFGHCCAFSLFFVLFKR